MVIFKRRRWRVILVMLIPLLTGIGPCTTGPDFMGRLPGGVISGEVATETINDWSFIADVGLCALETRPGFPHSVTVYCFTRHKKLYVPCMGCANKIWPAYVSNDTRARIKAVDKVYPIRVHRIEDEKAMQEIWNNARGRAGSPQAVPEGFWLYELTSR